MSQLNDKEIRSLCVNMDKPMIKPFRGQLVTEGGVISWGLSSFGYDFRIANEFKIFNNLQADLIDPKRVDEKLFYDVKTDDYVDIPPNSFALGHTIEWFDIPRDILVLVIGKSTYARCGININPTPLEPEWRGQITIEIANTTPVKARVYANEGIGQAVFLKNLAGCQTSYGDRRGKYQDQRGVVPPIVEQVQHEQ